jgi:hypothetical protein
MAFRLPTHVGSYIPPPSEQIRAGSTPAPASPPSGRPAPGEGPGTQPWRGNFVVSGLRPSDRAGNIEITVSAVEIDGDWYVG